MRVSRCTGRGCSGCSCAWSTRFRARTRSRGLSGWRIRGVRLGDPTGDRAGEHPDRRRRQRVPGAAPLGCLALEGRPVTADAIHCRTATAHLIRERRGDYLLRLKAKRPARQEMVARYLDTPDIRAGLATALTTDADHGRIETRRAWGIRAKSTATRLFQISSRAWMANRLRQIPHRANELAL